LRRGEKDLVLLIASGELDLRLKIKALQRVMGGSDTWQGRRYGTREKRLKSGGRRRLLTTWLVSNDLLLYAF
jgi:hypothetical protein